MTLRYASAVLPRFLAVSIGLATMWMVLWAAPSNAQQDVASDDSLATIVVRAHRLTDEQVTEEVATALRTDRYVDDAHVTVTTKDGVVTLHGFVQDAWDLLALRRISRKLPGVKKVVNDVELELNDQ
ncbi:MAG TPA: BON domain-containing protein [Steroidobacteraceae bacterium]